MKQFLSTVLSIASLVVLPSITYAQGAADLMPEVSVTATPFGPVAPGSIVSLPMLEVEAANDDLLPSNSSRNQYWKVEIFPDFSEESSCVSEEGLITIICLIPLTQ